MSVAFGAARACSAVKTIIARYSQGKEPSGLRREGSLGITVVRRRTLELRRAVLHHP